MKELFIKKKQKKTKIVINDNIITAYGPLGQLSYKIPAKISYKNKKLFIAENNFNFFCNKINKLIKSVTSGWYLELNLNGLGYKAFRLNDKIALDLGYSNLIIYKPTDNIKINNFKNKIILFSLDQEYLYNVGFTIKQYSMPDPYKGKGILRKNEIIKLKKKARS